MAAKAKELGKARIKRKKQVTLPDAVMETLGLTEGGEILFKARGKSIYIEPVVTITVPAEEAYAFTPEWQEQIRESLKQVEAGEVYGPFKSGEEILELAEKLRKEGKI
jgi:bifunctional DNA-binding transcriptional regulator/antitoxin component of YhaV-PrlF toxin-antitoxin module